MSNKYNLLYTPLSSLDKPRANEIFCTIVIGNVSMNLARSTEYLDIRSYTLVTSDQNGTVDYLI
jgi:hypothetical protein